MHPLDIILLAVIYGAAAGLQASTEQAVKDLYFKLKELISIRFGDVKISVLEEDPRSQIRQALVKEEFHKNSDVDYLEVLSCAEKLIQLIEDSNLQKMETIGLDITNATIREASIDSIESNSGTGVRINDSQIDDFQIGEVVTHKRDRKSPKVKRQ
jgi:hypothetical protein